jgi:hypothetical protein
MTTTFLGPGKALLVKGWLTSNSEQKDTQSEKAADTLNTGWTLDKNRGSGL